MEFDVLSNAIKNVLHVYQGEITPDATFVADFGADSIDLYQIYVLVEEELSIKMDYTKLRNIKTVQDAMNAILEAESKKE